MLEKIAKVNALLDLQGAKAVQKFARIKATGRDIYGYQPQRVFDCMNEVFGPGGWSHKIIQIDLYGKQVVARISVTLEDKTAEQFGEHRVFGSDVGSAHKSAVTDGIQKALSLFGVGAKAYRGELKSVFDESVSVSEEVLVEFVSLKKSVEKVKTKADGRVWWRENLSKIQNLPPEQRTELVRDLETKK